MSEPSKGKPTLEPVQISMGDVQISGSVIGSSSIFGVNVFAEVAAGVALATFLRAYCEELGKRFGGSTADWVSKIHLRRRKTPSLPADKARPDDVDLMIPVKGVVTSFEIRGDDLPDEAKLALLDLDITAEGVRGQRLKWDEKAQARVQR